MYDGIRVRDNSTKIMYGNIINDYGYVSIHNLV